MEKIRKFLVSDSFTAVLFVMAGIVVFTNNEIIGTVLFAAIIGIVMVLSDDFLPALQTILFTSCFAIRCKHSFDDFIKYVWVAPAIVILIISHFIIYKPKFKKGGCFYGILATSLAVTLGGLGSVSAKEYFSPTSIFYMFMLGFGMLLIYMYMSGTLKTRSNYIFSEKFSKIMACVILLLCVCLFEEYISRYDEWKDKFDILPFQWRNNASTLLMLAMPFSFYLSSKKFGWFFVGMLSYVAILFSGSRGGMIFGLIELGLCFAVMFVVDKRHRVAIAVITVVCFVGAVVLRHFLFDMISYTIARLLSPDENAIRLQLIPRGIQDFKSNILFGRGLGYMGNRDVHHSAEFTLCWYHCSPVQVIGSFGIFGIAAYSFVIYCRIKTLIKAPTFFNIIMFVSYVGLEMMSFVNPGIFAPFPYLFLVTVYFAAMENCNTDSDKQTLSNLIHGKKGEAQ